MQVFQEQNEFVTFAVSDFYDLNAKQATSSIVLPPKKLVQWKGSVRVGAILSLPYHLFSCHHHLLVVHSIVRYLSKCTLTFRFLSYQSKNLKAFIHFT